MVIGVALVGVRRQHPHAYATHCKRFSQNEIISGSTLSERGALRQG